MKWRSAKHPPELHRRVLLTVPGEVLIGWRNEHGWQTSPNRYLEVLGWQPLPAPLGGVGSEE